MQFEEKLVYVSSAIYEQDIYIENNIFRNFSQSPDLKKRSPIQIQSSNRFARVKNNTFIDCATDMIMLMERIEEVEV